MTFPRRARFRVCLIAILGIAGAAIATPAAAASCTSSTGISCSPSHAVWGFDDRVRAILRVGNVVYVGGRFHDAIRSDASGTVVETVRRDHLAAIDATTGDLLPWAPRIDEGGQENGDVYAMATYTPIGKRVPLVMVAGDFVDVASTTNGSTYTQAHREHFAAFRSKNFGALDDLTIDTGHRARAIAVHANRLYLGGSFSWVDTPTDPKTDRSRVAAFNLKKGGTIIRTWSPDVEGGSVYDLDTLPDGAIVLGGTFASLSGGGTTTDGFLGEVSQPGDVQPWADAPVGKVIDVKAATGDWCGLDPDTDACILTGQGDAAGGHAPNNGAALFDEQGHQLWYRGTDGDVQAVGWVADRAIIGGHFGEVDDTGGLGSVDAKKVAALDPLDHGDYDPSWKPNIVPAAGLGVWGILGTADALYLGGDFTQAKGEPTRRFAQFPIGP
jgi:hypothetical protein